MSCHLYATQVAESLTKMDLDAIEFPFIENVGSMAWLVSLIWGKMLK